MVNLSSKEGLLLKVRAGLVLLFICIVLPLKVIGSSEVVINEISWMGTKADSSDEWIELYNNVNWSISLEGWGLYEAGGETLIEPLSGVIGAKSYYLIERTNDTAVSDIPADQEPSGWGGYGLKNSGEYLQLLDQNSVIIDEVNASSRWFAGKASPDYRTMERKDSQKSGSDPNNWATNNGSIVNGYDAKGNLIEGTPKSKNSTILTIQPEQKQTQPVVYPSNILINEIMPSPKGQDSLEEWIELKNLNDREIDLSSWRIKDTIGSITTYNLPEGTKIGAKGFLVLFRPTTKITLNNSGDKISLIQPNGNILDSVNYEKAPREQSYNFIDGKWLWSITPTPGSINIITSPKASEVKKEKEFQKEALVGSSETQTPKETKRQLASVREQITGKDIKFLNVALIALSLALPSGIIILFFKKRLIRKKIDF
ncbi:MAG: lamin tail domain-containing protein [Patescibacteria group bacterium]|nr:lamin tail domain-containing protein [Patescibacteria group bacterium]